MTGVLLCFYLNCLRIYYFESTRIIYHNTKIYTMEISDRLTQIMTSKQMTSSVFADFLGIQRSNMSHYLNGRNKPGVDIIQKILDNLPDINAEWLILGRGEMYNITHPDLFGEYNNVSQPIPQSQPPVLKKVVLNRKIERITVYFDDGTFQEFRSESKK